MVDWNIFKKEFFCVTKVGCNPLRLGCRGAAGAAICSSFKPGTPFINFNLLSCVPVKSIHFSASIDSFRSKVMGLRLLKM
jgi:hypothetical protein